MIRASKELEFHALNKSTLESVVKRAADRFDARPIERASIETQRELKKANAGPTGKQRDSSSDEWCTPKWLAEIMGHYSLDPCSREGSHIRANYSVTNYPETDGLDLDWRIYGNKVWINCPYSRVMPWAKKAVEYAAGGGRVDMLVKLDPTTKWWAHLMTGNHVSVRAFRKRLKFERPDKPPLTANFPSALVSFGRGTAHESSIALQPHVWLF